MSLAEQLIDQLINNTVQEAVDIYRQTPEKAMKDIETELQSLILTLRSFADHHSRKEEPKAKALVKAAKDHEKKLRKLTSEFSHQKRLALKAK